MSKDAPSQKTRGQWRIWATTSVILVVAVITIAVVTSPSQPAGVPTTPDGTLDAVANSRTPVLPTYVPPPPSPVPPVLAATDFTIELKVIKKQCFGSAGCNVVVEPVINYKGPSLLSSQYGCDLTYALTGDESGEVIQTAEMDGMSYTFRQAHLSTKNTKVVPKATVTGVTCR